MMHYRKGENIEKQLTKEELPFDDFLPKGTEFLWMHVNGGTKVNNVLTFAKNALDKGEHKHIVWSGNGGGVVKTISCAEILKRSVEEHWKPQMEGLEEIVANRQIPSLHIFMSLEPINDNVSGLQKPNTKTDFWVYNSTQNAITSSSNNKNNHNHNKGKNSEQQRPRSNQNRNYQQNPRNMSNNNNISTEDGSGSSGGSQQRKSNNQKRRRPNHDREIQNPARKDYNVNRTESMEG